MDASTLRTISQPSSSSSNSFTARACDCASAFGRKVAPLAAGALIAWLSATAAPTIGAFCLVAGAVWTGYLVIKPLCSYVISLLFPNPEPESINNQLKEQLNISFDPITNKQEVYLSDNPHLVLTREAFFSEINRTDIESQFKADFTRSMHFEAQSPDGLTIFFETRAKELYFQKKKQSQVLEEIKCNRTDLYEMPSQPGSSERVFKTNESKLEDACHRAFSELSEGNKDLAATVVDLTTQTVGNAMSMFLTHTYSAYCHDNDNITCVSATLRNRTDCTRFERDNQGTINATMHSDIACCSIHLFDSRNGKNYLIDQELKIKASMLLDPLDLDQRKLGPVTVEFGKLLSFREL